MKMKLYVIKQGDYFTKLSWGLGYSPDDIWKRPENDEIRKRRPDMNMLAAGDIVAIPEAPEEPEVDIAAGSSNSYAVFVPTTTLKVKVLDADRAPVANRSYRVEGASVPITGQSDGEGVVTVSLPILVGEVGIVFDDPCLALRVKVGHMDPPEERSGLVKRLVHLGHFEGLSSDPTRASLGAAIRRFQAAVGLPVTGEPDRDTIDRLKQEHGS